MRRVAPALSRTKSLAVIGWFTRPRAAKASRRTRRLLIESLEGRELLCTFAVDLNTDSTAPSIMAQDLKNGHLSLREAVMLHNGDPSLMTPQLMPYLHQNSHIIGQLGQGQDIIDLSTLGQQYLTVTLTNALPALQGNLTITGNSSYGPSNHSRTGVCPSDGRNFSIFTIDAAATVDLTGLHIEGGRSDMGGGILNHGDLTLNRSLVQLCRADRWGGGIFNDYGATMDIIDSDVRFNRATISGGGIYNQGDMWIGSSGSGYSWSANAAVPMPSDGTGCMIDGNFVCGDNTGWDSRGHGYGGGIENDGELRVGHGTYISTNYAGHGGGIDSSGRLYVDGSIFFANWTQGDKGDDGIGGGIAVTSYTDFGISNTHFYGNTAGVWGGAVAAISGPRADMPGPVTLAPSTIESCTFESNMAGKGGGALYCSSAWTKISDSTFDHNGNLSKAYNRVSSSTLDGGAIYCTGSKLEIIGGKITYNACSRDGGGVFATDISLSLTDVVLEANTADGSGGGIHFNKGDLTIKGGTFRANTARSDGGAIDCHGKLIADASPTGTGGLNLTYMGVSYAGYLMFDGNKANGSGGAIHCDGSLQLGHGYFMKNHVTHAGGAVWARGSLQLSSSVFDDNWAGQGGAIYNSASGFITYSLLTANSADAGGAIYNFLPGNLTITYTEIEHNYCDKVVDPKLLGFFDGYNGGGIYNVATLTLDSSTIGACNADRGGGLFTLGTATLVNSTIAENQATTGAGILAGDGGVYGKAKVSLLFCTVAWNTARGEGGGLYGTKESHVVMNNTLIAYNTSGSYYPRGQASDLIDMYVDADNSFNNLIGVGRYSTNLVDGKNGNLVGSEARPYDPKLSHLADNGGPTKTCALGTGSAAIGKAKSVSGTTVDQRGFSRKATPDIGAYDTPAPQPSNAQDRSAILVRDVLFRLWP